jgi:hypothetical protein
MAVAHVGSDTLTGIRTPLCWTPLLLGVPAGQARGATVGRGPFGQQRPPVGRPHPAAGYFSCARAVTSRAPGAGDEPQDAGLAGITRHREQRPQLVTLRTQHGRGLSAVVLEEARRPSYHHDRRALLPRSTQDGMAAHSRVGRSLACGSHRPCPPCSSARA